MESIINSQPATPARLSVESIRQAQNFTLAIPAGIAAAMVGAGLWAAVTVSIDAKLGLMAVAVGFLVGRAIREVGKGIDRRFGILGAIAALTGSLLGNVLSDIGIYAKQTGIGIGDAMAQMTPELMERIVSVLFSPMDLLFWGIAVYEGYRFSFKYKLLGPVQPAQATAMPPVPSTPD